MNARPKLTRNRTARRNRVLPTAAIAALLMAAPALAADLYWDGGDGTWNLNSNWSENSANDTPDPANVPGQNDTAHFNRSGNNAVPQTINLGAVQSALGLVFSNTDTTNLIGLPANHGLNLYTGGITVNSGAGAVTLGSLTANEEMALVLVGDQTWTNNSSNPITIVNQVGNFSGTQLTLDGSSTALNTIQGNMPFGGLMNVVKNGTGTWVLSGSNTLGATFINEGKLIANSSGGVPLSGVIVGDGAGAAASAVLEFGDDNQLPANTQHTVNADGQVNLNGNSQVFGGGAPNGFQLNSATIVNSGTGVITMGANTAINGATGINSVTGGTIDLGGELRGFVSPGAEMTVSSDLINGGVGVTGGILNLDGNNTFAGGASVTGGRLNFNSNTAMIDGVLTIGSGATVGSTSGSTIAVTPSSIDISSGSITLAATSGLNLGTGAVSLGGSGSGFRSITVSEGTVTLGGDITANFSGSNTLGLFKLGPGTLVLSGNNSYTGNGNNTTAIRDGTLSIPTINDAGSSGPLGQVANVRMGNTTTTGTLQYTGGTASSTMPFVMTNTNSSGAFDVTESATVLTLSGPITSGGVAETLTKLGNGTLVMSSAGNSYNNATIVADGTLLVNGANTGAGAVTVQGGATLGGTGSINGATTAQANSTVAPGGSAGSLVLGTTFDLQSDATLAIQLGGTTFDFNVDEDYDRLKVNGASTLAGDLSVSLIDSFTLGANQLFGIVDAVGGLSGAFANFAEGDTVLTDSGYNLKITYLGTVTDGAVSLDLGNDVVLFTVAIPEPSSIALMGLASFGLFALNRRRRRKA